jgi:uncharacterized protein (DUF1800 family)
MLINQAAIALHRFGMGAAPGEARAIEGDPRIHLLKQLAGPPPTEDIGGMPTTLERVRAWADARRVDDPMRAQAREDAFIEACRRTYPTEMQVRLWTAAHSTRPFVERLVWFWSNHFAVSIGKPRVLPFAGAFEREAIRPHVLGRFSDMLLAVMRHPAMLVYLDNYDSVGPHSVIGRAQQRGTNENLGRELMELHTLGVNGGYSQTDVVALAAILTGWNVPVDGPFDPALPAFQFRPDGHEPGDIRLLGKVYPAGGIAQGEAALLDLAAHPSTARHIAVKLARYFVADQPPPPLVEQLAASFRDTGGDLRALAATLVRAPEAWAPERRKFRPPIDFTVAMARALRLDGLDFYSATKDLEQTPLAPSTPAGYPDTAAGWTGPAALLRRVELCLAHASWSKLTAAPVDFAFDILGQDLSQNTLEWLARAPNGPSGLGMVMVAPEFQWR